MSSVPVGIALSSNASSGIVTVAHSIPQFSGGTISHVGPNYTGEPHEKLNEDFKYFRVKLDMFIMQSWNVPSIFLRHFESKDIVDIFDKEYEPILENNIESIGLIEPLVPSSGIVVKFKTL